MSFVYLTALAVSLTGMVLLDRRFHLSFWADARRSAIALVLSVVFLLAWDFGGVANGIFFRGESTWMTGVLVGPEIPLEEVFFLALLSYLTLNVFGWFMGRAKAEA
jgi:lycopene cyclase domain-containing protein